MSNRVLQHFLRKTVDYETKESKKTVTIYGIIQRLIQCTLQCSLFNCSFQ